MDWIRPGEDRDKRRAVVNMVMNLERFYISQFCCCLVCSGSAWDTVSEWSTVDLPFLQSLQNSPT